MLQFRSRPFALHAGVALALGCGASVPAQEPDAVFLLPTSDDDCIEAVTPIEHSDDQTPLGFSAVDVLSHVAGPRSEPLFWLEPPSNQEYLLSYGPEHGRSTIGLDLRLNDGPILHRHRTPSLGAPDETTCDPGALEIPVVVTVESAAQGLAESFDAVLRASTPYRGHLSKALEPAVLRGSLGLAHVTSLDPERSFWLGAVTLEADVWEGGSAGSLSIYVGASHARPSKELRAPPSEAEQPGQLAAWPSAQSCEGTALALPTNARVLGFSVDDVLEQLRADGSRQLTWSDGRVTPVRLELDAAESELCQEIGEHLSFGLTLRARSEDGSLDVRLPVQVDALDAGGTIGDIAIESAEPDAPYPVARAVEGARVDTEGYRSVLVDLEWSHAGDRDSGSLSLRGVDAAQPDANGTYPSTPITSGRW
jgi:hypothetical protein